ncbi:MAG: Radical SAM domain protein [Parcubacteria group bacterium GW2011_GWA2_38_13]|nr:MAG: Radical SAM domain protein [Parcubacteria group bacterium GW2011_GWA2_38_13]
MKITFILPSVGRKIRQKKYLKTWQMEPLAIAQLASLTPKDITMEFFDDRLEDIDYQTDTDLVAINIETYTARRAYEIAAEFKSRGKKIIMGGFHATLIPDEVANYADSVMIGEAENLWQDVLIDLKNNQLKKIYQAEQRPDITDVFPDRNIYKGKNYLKLGLIEAGRGCRFNCDFCSITNFYNHTYRQRSIDNIIKEIRSLNYKYYFFVNDNICADFEYAKELFKALIPLKIKWISQASMNIAKDENLLLLMKQSGCQGVLIGFESMDLNSLKEMNKPINSQAVSYDEVAQKMHSYGIRIYATFVFGYDSQNKDALEHAFKFVMRNKMTIAAFNHLVPFPGTPLYKRLEAEDRLLYKKWWLEPGYHFGQVAFKPKNMPAEELAELCHTYRRKLYSFPSLIKRMSNIKIHCNSLSSLFIFFSVNVLSKIDARKRKGLPLGKK